MKVITIGQRKGGNGKSTSALSLAHAFALAGKRVLLLDLDDQKNTTSSISCKEPGPYTVEDLLLNPSVSVETASRATLWAGVSLIASSSSLSGVIRELDSEVGGHLVLKEKLSRAEGFDVVLIDTSPSLNILVVASLCASDYLFIPLSSKYFSLQGLGQTLEAFDKVKARLNPGLRVLALAFVIHDKRSTLARDVVGQALKDYPELVCASLVSQNIKIEEAQVVRQSIFTYAPKDKGAVQYRALAGELLARMGV